MLRAHNDLDSFHRCLPAKASALSNALPVLLLFNTIYKLPATALRFHYLLIMNQSTIMLLHG